MKCRAISDEAYVIDLCDDVLGRKALRQHRFDFLLGDPSIRSGRCVRLPVDAYYSDLNLVIEFMERQHSEAVPFFDRRITGTGMPRSEQRRLYDERRMTVLPKHGIHLVVLHAADLAHRRQKLLRHRHDDENIIRLKLAAYLR